MSDFFCFCVIVFVLFFFFKQKTAYEMRISDWSSDVCSSDLLGGFRLFPSLTVSETYDDNIFAEEDDEEADFITAITGGVLLRSEWTRHDFTFDAQVRDRKSVV